MADRKISDLTALTTPATGDLLPIVDISEAAAADKNKSITVGELLRGAPDGTAAAPGIAFESDGGNGMFLGGTDILAFSTGGTQAVTIDASQRLGVGTSSPAGRLEIKDNGYRQGIVLERGGSTTDRGFIYIGDGTNSTVADEIYLDAYNTAFHFRQGGTGTTETVTFKSDGKVGVGTASPRAHVDFGSGSGHGVLNQTVGNYQAVFESPQGTGNIARNIAFAVGTNGIGAAINAVDTGGSDATGLIVATGTAGSITERLRIDSNGNVGVGTSSPQLQLSLNHVTQPKFGLFVNNTEQYRFQAVSGGNYIDLLNANLIIRGGASGTTNIAAITNAGNVGIGTTSPTEELEISSATPAMKLSDTDEAGSYGTVSMSSSVMYLQSNGAATNGQLIYRSGNAGTFTERLRIDSSGRLLIGTPIARTTGNSIIPAVQLEGVSSVSDASFTAILNRSADLNGPRFVFTKTRGTSTGSTTIVQNGDELGSLYFCGADGTDLSTRGAQITAYVDGTPGTDDMPGRLVFSTTGDGASTPTERMRIRADGTTITTGTTILFGGNAATAGTPRSIAFGSNEIAWTAGGSGGTNLFLNGCDTAGNNGSSYSMYFRGLASSGSAGAALSSIYFNSSNFSATAVYSSTTASGANVYVHTDGKLFRSTSSAKYKTNIETLEDSYADALLSCRPVWYQSTASDSELHPDWGYWGFIAEEVAEVDPRLVSWKTHEETLELDGSKTVEELAEPVPEGVQYDRFVPHLLNLIKRQKEQIEALEARLTAAGI